MKTTILIIISVRCIVRSYWRIFYFCYYWARVSQGREGSEDQEEDQRGIIFQSGYYRRGWGQGPENVLAFLQKLYAKDEKNTIIIISLINSGVSFSKKDPSVDPNRLHGIIIKTISQSTSEVYLLGCFLNTTLITLGRAEPATIGCISAVD